MTLKEQINQLRQKRAKAIADARAVYDHAFKSEKRSTLNADEAGKWDGFMTEERNLKTEIDRLERQLALESEIEGTDQRDHAGNPGEQRDERSADAEKRTMAAFGKFLTRGINSLDTQEQRDLSVGSGPDGGFIVAPQAWVAQLIKFIDDQTFIRQKATKMTLTSAESLGIPSLDTDVSDADWTSEIATGSADSSLKFGKRELKPSPLAKRIKVSNKLIRIGSMPVEALVQQRLGYKFAVTEEKAFQSGNGVGKPLGLFVASNDGISTGRDVSSGANAFSAADAAASKVSADALIDMKFKLKGQYWGRAEWLFHRDLMKVIAKLVDGDGRYLFRESLRAGEPDTLLGRPINMSEFTPNTNTTGQYIGLLGDFSYYHIVDALNMQVQRLTELYAESNQTGYIGRAEVDGMPVLEEAFARLKNT